MRSRTIRSILGTMLTWIAAVGFSCSSIGYWRTALANGFSGLSATKVLSSTFLAILSWAALAILYWRRRQAALRDKP